MVAAWTGLTTDGDQTRRSDIRCTSEAKVTGSPSELDRPMRRGRGKKGKFLDLQLEHLSGGGGHGQRQRVGVQELQGQVRREDHGCESCWHVNCT